MLLHEILWRIVKTDAKDKKKILEYLNCFIKFCNKFKDLNTAQLGFTDEEILRCLRTSFLHESAEVRAAGIRSIRHFIKTEQHVKCLYKLKLDFLIARSIDICLDNKTERIQALRLVRKLLAVDQENFSLSLARCLIAISRDGNDKNSKDLILRTCLAILSELIILNPELSYRCDLFSSLMDSVCRCSNLHNILESVLGSYIYLINNPELRIYTEDAADLQKFIGIFTDLPYVSWTNAGDPAKSGMSNSQICAIDERKNILVSIFRSWPGLIHMCKTTKNDILLRRNPATLQLHAVQEQYHQFQIKNVQNLNGIQTLIEMMYLPFEETRKHLMEVIFELFYLSVPDWVDDFETALLSTNLLNMQDNWQLYNGFVAAEAKSLLPHISKHRLNFTDNYISLLLYSFISNGLLESLISIVISPDNLFNSVRATILLGELLHLTNRYLPPEMSQVCHSLPQLMNACISDRLTIKQKTIANTAVSCLNKMHSLKKKPVTPASLFLDMLLQFSNPSYRPSLYDLQLNKWKARDLYYKMNEETAIFRAIKASQVLLKEFASWDWSLIGFLLKMPCDYVKRIDENTQQKLFIRRLISFFKPTSKQFSSIEHNHSNAKEISLVGLYLVDFLMECEESKAAEFIDDLMTDLNLCLSQISIDSAPSTTNCILGPGKMRTTLSSAYFLYLGKLSNTSKGKKLLERSGIYEYLVNLIASTTSEDYIKLIISGLDYNQDGFSRKLLSQALNCKLEAARLYATNFLRVLLRAEMSDFHKWVIELLVQQLSDANQSVCLSALDILDEACDKSENLVQLISLRPNLLHLNDKGILLFSRFASCEIGFTYLNDTNLLSVELERWRKTFSLKYVNIVEDLFNETFTYHQKSEDTNSYGRRMEKRHFMVKKNAYLPPHLYGQLALHKRGCELLAKESVHLELIERVKRIVSFDIQSPIDKKMHCSELIDYKELTILQLKAALWACSHIASTELGLSLIKDTEFIQIVTELASNCQLLSVRGVAFYCLGLISTTELGSELLFEHGWIALRHSRSEKWPIYKEMIEKNEVFSFPFKQLTTSSREYASSISSSIGTSRPTHTSQLSNALNNKPCSVHNSASGLMTDTSSAKHLFDDDEQLSKSLSHIENGKHKLSFNKPEQLKENFTNGNSAASANKLHGHLASQVRPRSSSDCQQKVSFNLQDRNQAADHRLENHSNSTIGNLQQSATANSIESTNRTPAAGEISKANIKAKTNSVDRIEHHHLDGNRLESDHGSSDQLTSPVSLGDAEYGHSRLNSDPKSTYFLPTSTIDENSTYEITKDATYRIQKSFSSRNPRPIHLLHPGPKRKRSEPIGSSDHPISGSIKDFKTMHQIMIRGSTTNIYQMKHGQKASDAAANNGSIHDEETAISKANLHYSTSYPESIKSHSYEHSPVPTGSIVYQQSNRDILRKLSQITNPNSFERNYSLYINPHLTEEDLEGNCDHVLGLQDESFEIAMPNTKDTIGYAAMKSLRNKMEKICNQVLMFNNQFSYLKEGLLQSREQEKGKLYELNGDNEFTKEFTNGFKLSAGRPDDFRIKSEFYISICVPDNLSLIFDLEVFFLGCKIVLKLYTLPLLVLLMTHSYNFPV